MQFREDIDVALYASSKKRFLEIQRLIKFAKNNGMGNSSLGQYLVFNFI